MTLKKNFIAGEWIEGVAGIYKNINPSDTADIVGEYALADAEQTQQAIDAAAAALPEWAGVGMQRRFEVLDAIGSEILARADELGKLLAREEGKSLPESKGEVIRAGQIFKFFAGETLRPGGERLPSVRPGVCVDITREPVGVVGLIAPWNFPIAIPAWKIAPALAYGNTVVFKPASIVPGCAHALAEIIARQNLPAGTFNLVMGGGSAVGATIVESAQVNAVSFTGSVETGRSIGEAVTRRGGKFQAEMGGKNPLIVLDDADLDVAVNCAVQGAFYSTGQRCTASSRLIVTEGIHDRFVDAVVEKLSTLTVGPAQKEGTDIGPVADQTQFEQNLEYLRIGREEGATLAFGGNVVECETQGYFMKPALFTNTHNGMRINREEIFGPIATVIKAADFEEALQIANDTPFGLSAGICTSSLKYAEEFKRRSEAGMTMVNLPTAGVDYHVPFGGRKGSSMGPREQGSYAKEFYTTVKTSYMAAL